MCGNMVDIQSATAENRRGKNKKPQRYNRMSASATQGGHNNQRPLINELFRIVLSTPRSSPCLPLRSGPFKTQLGHRRPPSEITRPPNDFSAFLRQNALTSFDDRALSWHAGAYRPRLQHSSDHLARFSWWKGDGRWGEELSPSQWSYALFSMTHFYVLLHRLHVQNGAVYNLSKIERK